MNGVLLSHLLVLYLQQSTLGLAQLVEDLLSAGAEEETSSLLFSGSSIFSVPR